MLYNARVSSNACVDWIGVHVMTLEHALIYRGYAMDLSTVLMAQMRSIVFVPRMSFNAATVHAVEDVTIKPRFLISNAFQNHRFKTVISIV